MMIPNEGRIIVELVRKKGDEGGIILPETVDGTLKAGEDIWLGRVVHPGKPVALPSLPGVDKDLSVRPEFKKGQLVAFMEYSMHGFYRDISALVDGKVSAADQANPENKYYIVPEADVMAYEEIDDDSRVQQKTKGDKS